jgi:hypothetical protein
VTAADRGRMTRYSETARIRSLRAAFLDAEDTSPDTPVTSVGLLSPASTHKVGRHTRKRGIARPGIAGHGSGPSGSRFIAPPRHPKKRPESASQE